MINYFWDNFKYKLRKDSVLNYRYTTLSPDIIVEKHRYFEDIFISASSGWAWRQQWMFYAIYFNQMG